MAFALHLRLYVLHPLFLLLDVLFEIILPFLQLHSQLFIRHYLFLELVLIIPLILAVLFYLTLQMIDSILQQHGVHESFLFLQQTFKYCDLMSQSPLLSFDFLDLLLLNFLHEGHLSVHFLVFLNKSWNTDHQLLLILLFPLMQYEYVFVNRLQLRLLKLKISKFLRQKRNSKVSCFQLWPGNCQLFG